MEDLVIQVMKVPTLENAALIDNNGEDVNKNFTEQSTGTLYLSFLLDVQKAYSGYFIHFLRGSSDRTARVFMKSSGASNYYLGVTTDSTTGNYGTTKFDYSTTYLCIVEFDFSTTRTNLWVKSSGVPVSKIDAGPVEATAVGISPVGLNAVGLRQFNTGQIVIVDGIRVSDSWSLAPLPVELTSFSAIINDGNVLLNWATATEVDNYGFDIERKVLESRLWEKIGFIVGHGNSNSSNNYRFIDENIIAGECFYRLKQIDINGDYEYSDEIEVFVQAPTKFNLEQNYPNPFNPSTKINYSIPTNANVKLFVSNILGENIALLVDEFKEAGKYSVEFKAENLSSGIYFYQLQYGNESKIKKVLLIR